MRLGVRQVGVLLDDLGDGFGGILRNLVDAFADGRLVGQVGLEHQPERRTVTIHELEVGAYGGCDTLFVVRGRRQGCPDQTQELTRVTVSYTHLTLPTIL